MHYLPVVHDFAPRYPLDRCAEIDIIKPICNTQYCNAIYLTSSHGVSSHY